MSTPAMSRPAAWLGGIAISLLLLTSEAGADTPAWSTGATNSKESLFAATTNDSGALLGQYCDLKDRSCMWELGLSLSCENGAKYPLLANADSGAIELQVVCMGVMPNNLYGYAFDNFDKVDSIVKGNARVGFAFPLQEGEFRVVRFLLNGASAAVAQMRGTVESTPTQKVRSRSDTRDVQL
jgi:hypothetical protein